MVTLVLVGAELCWIVSRVFVPEMEMEEKHVLINTLFPTSKKIHLHVAELVNQSLLSGSSVHSLQMIEQIRTQIIAGQSHRSIVFAYLLLQPLHVVHCPLSVIIRRKRSAPVCIPDDELSVVCD